MKEIHGQKAHIEKKPNPIAAIQIAKSWVMSSSLKRLLVQE